MPVPAAAQDHQPAHASATALLTCTFMAAPALQLDCTGSLALLLVCASLMLVRQRRYAGFAVVVLALALTRPIALALVPVGVAHRLARHQCLDRDPFTPADRWRVGLLVPWCAAATGLWPLIAAVANPRHQCDLQTMAAWRSYPANTPVLGWLGYVWREGVAGLLLCAVALPCSFWSYDGPPPAPGGTEVRAWAYPAYGPRCVRLSRVLWWVVGHGEPCLPIGPSAACPVGCPGGRRRPEMG